MRIIQTTKGALPEAALERTVGLEDRPDCLALWVEFRELGDASRELVRRDTFRIGKTTGDQVTTTRGLLPRDALRRVVELEDNAGELVVAEVFRVDDEVVHRSVHVVKKHPSVEATGVAARIG